MTPATSPSGRNASPILLAVLLVAAVGLALLFVGLFLDWYQLGAEGQTITASGWTSFEMVDVAIVLIVLAGLWLLTRLYSTAERGTERLLVLGIVALVVVGLQLVEKAPTIEIIANTPGSGVSDSLETGAFVSLAGAVLLLIAGVLNLARSAEVRARAGDTAPVGPGGPVTGDPPTRQDVGLR